MKFTVEWCELCGCHFVRCPKCGNNSCNAGYGTLDSGETCDVCPLAYQYQELMWKIFEKEGATMTERYVYVFDRKSGMAWRGRVVKELDGGWLLVENSTGRQAPERCDILCDTHKDAPIWTELAAIGFITKEH